MFGLVTATGDDDTLSAVLVRDHSLQQFHSAHDPRTEAAAVVFFAGLRLTGNCSDEVRGCVRVALLIFFVEERTAFLVLASGDLCRVACRAWSQEHHADGTGNSGTRINLARVLVMPTSFVIVADCQTTSVNVGNLLIHTATFSTICCAFLMKMILK